MKRSYFGGLRVKPGPTKVGLVTMRFHCFFCRLPDRMTLNISSSAMGRTCHSHDIFNPLQFPADVPAPKSKTGKEYLPWAEGPPIFQPSASASA